MDLDGERWKVMKMTMLFIWSAHSFAMLPTTSLLLAKTVNCSPASSTPLWPVAHVNQASTSDQSAGDRPCTGHRVRHRGSVIMNQSQERIKPRWPRASSSLSRGGNERMGLHPGHLGFEFRSDFRASTHCPSGRGEECPVES